MWKGMMSITQRMESKSLFPKNKKYYIIKTPEGQ